MIKFKGTKCIIIIMGTKKRLHQWNISNNDKLENSFIGKTSVLNLTFILHSSLICSYSKLLMIKFKGTKCIIIIMGTKKRLHQWNISNNDKLENSFIGKTSVFNLTFILHSSLICSYSKLILRLVQFPPAFHHSPVVTLDIHCDG